MVAMHVVVVFNNIGSYHAARLRSAHAACRDRGWRLTAIQVTDGTLQHPWGDLSREITFPIETLVPMGSTSFTFDTKYGLSVPPSTVERLLDRLATNVVAVPGWGFPVAKAALKWCRRHGAAAVLMSESKRDDAPRREWREFLKSWLYVRRFDAALVGGRLHRDYVIELGLPPQRVFLGYDVVDNQHFAREADLARQNPAAVRSRQPGLPTTPFFLSVTRFLPRKNIPTLIRGYAAYRHVVGKEAWALVICGSGDQEAEMRAMIREEGLANSIYLPGFVPYHGLGDWYGLAEAFIHPALQEQWGLVVNEACAAGLPVLCSQMVGACYELVRDGWNGLVFDPADVEDLTRVLLAIYRLDPALRKEMGRNGQQLVAEFGPERFASGLITAIESVGVGTTRQPGRIFDR